jgi:hypothetical protein
MVADDQGRRGDPAALFHPWPACKRGGSDLDCCLEHLPTSFDGPGFRERDERIAEDCDELVRIADSSSRTYGSGWTRDRARAMGKPTAEYVIDSAERRSVEAERE